MKRTKRIPKDIKQEFPEVSWKPAAAMRDFLIHEYPEVDVGAVWDTIVTDLPKLKSQVQKIMTTLQK